MLIHSPSPFLHCKTAAALYLGSPASSGTLKDRKAYPMARAASGGFNAATAGVVAAAVVLASAAAGAGAGAIEPPPTDPETLSNVPQTLSGECAAAADCKKPRIQRPKSRKAESCTVKCVTTCIRGGDGSPGEGPFNIRRPLVVFKQGFRSRNYCLVECSDICNLMGDNDDWP